MKILMLKGLPGSGKSTWAKTFVAQNPGWVRVNKDSLREMIGSYRPGKDESLIIALRDEVIRTALGSIKSVVVDDTNFHPKHEKRLRELAAFFGAEFEELKFDTPIEDCIANDLQRPNSVGEKVIRKMYREFLAPKAWKLARNPLLQNAIICDIDGTLAIHNGRSPYDVEKCGSDLPNRAIVDIVRDYAARGLYIFLVSGREEKYRGETEQWLMLNRVPYHRLWMRPTGDFRKDDVVKDEIYRTLIQNQYNIEFVLDDRNRVVDMWRRNGLTCLQVAEGDF